MTSSPAGLDAPRGRFWNGKPPLHRVFRDYGIVLVFLCLFVTLAVASESFMTRDNLMNILDQNVDVGLIAVGTTVVLLVGGFDISVGATYALAGVVAAKIAFDGDPALGLIVGVLAGTAVGIVNAALSSVINPFIATLATAIIVGGVAFAVTDGASIAVPDPSYTTLGQGGIGDLTYGIMIWLVVTAVVGFALWRTPFGRAVFATGGNDEAARLSGIRTARVRAAAYVLCGTLAGLAGAIVSSRVGTGEATAGGFNLAVLAIAGVVVGGTSILGGEGAVWRSIVGVLFLALIGNGFVLLEVDSVYQDIVRGAIILLAVGIDAWARRARTS